jgi:hypothetical protein
LTLTRRLHGTSSRSRVRRRFVCLLACSVNTLSRAVLPRFDRYEEYLLLLDEISEREFKLLLVLERHEATFPRKAEENRL